MTNQSYSPSCETFSRVLPMFPCTEGEDSSGDEIISVGRSDFRETVHMVEIWPKAYACFVCIPTISPHYIYFFSIGRVAIPINVQTEYYLYPLYKW